MPQPYQYIEPRKTRKWSTIVMGVLGIIILLGIIAFFVLNPLSSISKNMRGFFFGDDNSTRHTDQESGPPVLLYNCESDVYNCDDFATQSEAQLVFDACGPEDIHGLDNDGDRVVCEGLA